MKQALALGMLLVLLPVSLAQADVPFFDEEKIRQTAALLEGDFEPVRGVPDPNTAVLLVEGKELNAVERALFPYVMQRYPALERVTPTPESQVTAAQVLAEQRMVILVGGPSQNGITREVLAQVALQERDHPSKDFLAIYGGKTLGGAELLVLSDRRGFDNVPRLGPSRSPLAKFMSPPAVVATASAISLFLMWLWGIIGGPIRVVAARLITTKKAAKAKAEAAASGFTVGGMLVRYREVAAIIGAALLYATASTIAVIGFGVPLLQALKINLIGGLAFYGIREVARIIMSHRMKLQTEYIFWLPGAIFGLISGWLGNTLNIPGYVKTFQGGDAAKFAKMRYTITVGTFVLAVAFLVLNLAIPSIGRQLFGIIASTYAAVEILPVRPCPGKEIFAWRPALATITLMVVWPVYLLFNFVL